MKKREVIKRAAENCQRLAGMIRYIISRPEWIRLGFEQDEVECPFVENVMFQGFRRMEEVTNRGNLDLIMYRALLKVTVNESTLGPVGDPVNESSTCVSLEENRLRV